MNQWHAMYVMNIMRSSDKREEIEKSRGCREMRIKRKEKMIRRKECRGKTN
jgi:hypothetical protein